jgi:hypothetical protein
MSRLLQEGLEVRLVFADADWLVLAVEPLAMRS